LRGELRIAESEVPQSVRLVVGRRLARLSEPTQRMLDMAAVIGRSFILKVLEACTAGEGLAERLEEAERAGLIFSNADSPNLEFSHELIRQAVIRGLGSARRQVLHERMGQTLESMYAGQLDDHINELAYHYGYSNNVEKAVEYFPAAGESAMRRFAYREAEAHFRSALEMVEKLAPGRRRDEQELQVLAGLQSALVAINGIGFGQMAAMLARSAELCRRLGRDAELAETLRRNAGHHLYVGDMVEAVSLATQALAVANRIKDPERIETARKMLGNIHF
jgi:predicted ATPase